MIDEEISITRQKYVDILAPLFFPDDSISNDIVNYFASLLRIAGMEDKGWDPYFESRAMLGDLQAIIEINLPKEKFRDTLAMKWRISLLMYSHIVEMNAPYEVLTNLLRFRLGKGYSPNPFFMFLSREQKKRFQKSGLYPKQKIEIIKKLSREANLRVGDIFDDFINYELRNAISHSDFIITDNAFRSRSGMGAFGAFSIPLKKLDEVLTMANIFTSSFLSLEAEARKHWGRYKGKAIPYDAVYKGLIEVLVAENNYMCGFKVHWPNYSESTYRRTDDGVEMVNCWVNLSSSKIELMVGSYARVPSRFSPLVEEGSIPRYTKLAGMEATPQWTL
jgi:hypothetical protein